MGAGRRGGHGIIRAGRAGHGRPGRGRGRLGVGERPADGEQHRAQRDVRAHRHRCLGGGRPVRRGGPDATTSGSLPLERQRLVADPHAQPRRQRGAERGQRERRQRRLGGGVHPPQRLPRPAAPVRALERQRVERRLRARPRAQRRGRPEPDQRLGRRHPRHRRALGRHGLEQRHGAEPEPVVPGGRQPERDHRHQRQRHLGGGLFTNTSFTTSAFALHYNGSSWTVTVLPQPAVTGPSSPILHGVTAVASNNVWAVGENEEVPGLGITTLIEHWNGTAWSIVPSPTPGAYPALNAVAARSASDVYAVGFNMPSVNGGVQQGMILRWNGSAWSADTDPTAGTFSPLYGAATLPGGTSEWAAGINAADHALVLSHG